MNQLPSISRTHSSNLPRAVVGPTVISNASQPPTAVSHFQSAAASHLQPGASSQLLHPSPSQPPGAGYYMAPSGDLSPTAALMSPGGHLIYDRPTYPPRVMNQPAAVAPAPPAALIPNPHHMMMAGPPRHGR